VTDTLSAYADRIATAAAAVELVKAGDHVFLGTGCATPLSRVRRRARRACVRRKTSSTATFLRSFRA